jgi:alpha-mannosidase
LPPSSLDAHVVAHTHWDREWYLPVERFRQRLVALIDELLDAPPAPGQSFLLDGQTIVLDDYLAVRPDRAAELHALLRDGRIEAGPWFVLADELIPSGEALVRNLLAGRRTLRRIGVDAPPVLYCPDSFGHPAALPAIAAGFGFPLIVLWRGFGSARFPRSDVVQWTAPGGESALVYHLPRDGYEFGSHLPLDADASRARWARMREELAARSATGVVLIPAGADHHAPQRGAGDAVALLGEIAHPDRVHASSLRGFAETLVARTRGLPLPNVRGELRDSYGYTWTLQGTFSTRAHEKRMNASAERALLRDAEPWAALASRLGASRRALVDAAWGTLLEAHPHDTLCGCSIDEVADAMELRVRSALNQANGIRDDAIAALVGYDAAAAREPDARARWQPVVIVRNATPRPRGGVAFLEVEQFIADVAVGPGSAPTAPVEIPLRGPRPRVAGAREIQRLSSTTANRRIESPRHYPDNDLVRVTRVAAWIDPVPAYGVAPLPIDAASTRASNQSVDAPVDPRFRVAATSRSLENGLLRVTVGDEGVVTLDDLVTHRRIAGLLEVLDDGDAGDTYTSAPRARRCELSYLGARRTQRGPLVGEIVLRYRLRVAPARGVVTLAISLRLVADAPWFEVGVSGENALENHRLRLAFRTDVSPSAVWADAAFGSVLRERLHVSSEEAAVEAPPPTAPLHRNVSIFGPETGATLISDGLAEYEATDDGAIIVTLLRAVGELSRNDLPERPGHAGWPAPTPGAQCLRPFEGRFALLLHGARSPEVIDAIERATDDVLLPLVGTTLRAALDVPPPVSGIALSGAGLAVSTIKESDDGLWIVLRCVNLLDEPVAGSWSLPFEVVEARFARLDETPMQEVASLDRQIRFEAAPRAIVTLLVR